MGPRALHGEHASVRGAQGRGARQPRTGNIHSQPVMRDGGATGSSPACWKQLAFGETQGASGSPASRRGTRVDAVQQCERTPRRGVRPGRLGVSASSAVAVAVVDRDCAERDIADNVIAADRDDVTVGIGHDECVVDPVVTDLARFGPVGSTGDASRSGHRHQSKGRRRGVTGAPRARDACAEQLHIATSGVASISRMRLCRRETSRRDRTSLTDQHA